MNHDMELVIARHAAAKKAVMEYPHYTNEQRNSWCESIDGSLNTILQAYKNAEEAFENAIKKYEYNKT